MITQPVFAVVQLIRAFSAFVKDILRLGRLLQLKNQPDQNPKNEEVPRNLDETGFVVSKNLYGSLPDDEIDLGIQINSANEGRFAGLYNVYLYLYKK